MFFDLPKEDKNITMIKAYRRIISYKTGPHEILLNNYFIKNYKTSLKQMCLKLLTNAVYNNAVNNKLIVTFRTLEQDKIASLITYGNGVLSGSGILAFAFRRDE